MDNVRFKGIVRIDTRRPGRRHETHGWQARLYKKRGKSYRSKLFSDGVFGSSRKALRAARLWLEKKTGRPVEVVFKRRLDKAFGSLIFCPVCGGRLLIMARYRNHIFKGIHEDDWQALEELQNDGYSNTMKHVSRSTVSRIRQGFRRCKRKKLKVA